MGVLYFFFWGDSLEFELGSVRLGRKGMPIHICRAECVKLACKWQVCISSICVANRNTRTSPLPVGVRHRLTPCRHYDLDLKSGFYFFIDIYIICMIK